MQSEWKLDQGQIREKGVVLAEQAGSHVGLGQKQLNDFISELSKGSTVYVFTLLPTIDWPLMNHFLLTVTWRFGSG